MTDEQIDHLVSARNAITNLTDEYPNMRAVNEIDAVLRDVPPGQRADVDALLGRKRVVMVQHISGDVEVAPEFDTNHLHQCGWCGEWYTGARVDHGCPAPQDEID